MAMGWKIVAMIQEARDLDDLDRTTQPRSCPICYTPLREGIDTNLFCPWDGLQYPHDAYAWGEYPGAY